MSLRALCTSILLFVGACGLVFAQAPRLPATRWSRLELQTIDRIASAYYQSETRSMLEMLSRLIGRLSNERIDSLNRELAARKLPDAATLLIEARLSYVQQGLTKQLPKPSPREAILLLTTLDQHVSRTLQAATDHPAMASPVVFPGTSQDWNTVLWKLHVLENQLETARLMAETMTRLAKGYPTGGAINLSESDRKLIQADYSGLAAKVQLAAWDVEEREIELRAARLAAALSRLEDPSLDVERFLSAYTAELDSRIVTDFADRVSKGDRQVRSAILNDSGAIETAATQAKRVRELAKDLPYRAALFYEGLHWWLRGRYGMGPDAGGLAKSAEALYSPAAQFGLYMPSETPRPTDPADTGAKQSVPTFDRRHHYWWAWEDRRLHRGASSSSTQGIVKDKFSVTLSRFW